MKAAYLATLGAIVTLTLIGCTTNQATLTPTVRPTMTRPATATIAVGSMIPTTSTPISAARAAASKNVYEVAASNFKYVVNGVDNPPINVKLGDVVTINLSSTQGMHDFVIDGLNARSKILQQDESGSVTFTASKAGEFEYYCSVGNHREMGMKGKLMVE